MPLGKSEIGQLNEMRSRTFHERRRHIKQTQRNCRIVIPFTIEELLSHGKNWKGSWSKQNSYVQDNEYSEIST